MVHSSKPISRIEEQEFAAPRCAALPGLPDSSNALPYKSPFFGAQRDWPNDEVGWTKIPHFKTVYKINRETGERKKIQAKVTRRDINREERRQAGWNLLDC
jgi:hypothetical protein